MFNDPFTPACHVLDAEVQHFQPQVRRRRYTQAYDHVVGPWSFRAILGRGTIRLTAVEYRILKFLASRPYYAFTRRHIAEAVSTESQPVTAETLGRHIQALRDQLGFYSDYIQTVPYCGYRFKA
jgi:two-component system alkaline phosphatase synthesis response regulator PhoP